MSDDDFERQSGPSNPWGKPSGPRSSVPEIGRPEQAEAFRTDSAENRSAADSSGQTPPSRNGAIGKVYYDDSEGGLVPLAIKGHLLTLITLGIYRFWYLTNLRRFFWSHTRVHDSALEYTGRGMEIFIGFLIAMAVVVPLNFVPVFLTASLGPVGAIVAFFIPLLYFFLILVADRQGLSYYHYDKICSLLCFSVDDYIFIRDQLIDKDLIAFDGTFFQVLSLPRTPVRHPVRLLKISDDMETSDPATIEQILSRQFNRDHES